MCVLKLCRLREHSPKIEADRGWSLRGCSSPGARQMGQVQGHLIMSLEHFGQQHCCQRGFVRWNKVLFYGLRSLSQFYSQTNKESAPPTLPMAQHLCWEHCWQSLLADFQRWTGLLLKHLQGWKHQWPSRLKLFNLHCLLLFICK